MLIVQINSSSNEQKNSSNEHESNSFELLVVSTTHVVRRAVQTNISSNEQLFKRR